MTDRAYRAKNWLLRVEELEELRKCKINTVMMLEAKVNNCIVNYESNGSRDPMTARAAKEDVIIDYSNARAELQELTERVIHEDLITIAMIERLHNMKYCCLLTARYVARKSMKQIINEKMFSYEKTQFYKLEHKALDALGEILEAKPEKIQGQNIEIIQETRPIKTTA